MQPVYIIPKTEFYVHCVAKTTKHRTWELFFVYILHFSQHPIHTHTYVGWDSGHHDHYQHEHLHTITRFLAWWDLIFFYVSNNERQNTYYSYVILLTKSLDLQEVLLFDHLTTLCPVKMCVSFFLYQNKSTNLRVFFSEEIRFVIASLAM